MRHLVVFALVSFVAINAGPISVEDNNVGDIVTAKLDLSAVLSNKVDQNVINAIILALNQQGENVGNIDASENQDDKVALIKKMLKRKINLPQAVEAVSATQNEASSAPKIDFKNKFESKIAQFKRKLPENLKLQENLEFAKFKLPTKYETKAAEKPVKAPKSFKIPESVQLPEKFARKFKNSEKFEIEEAEKSFKIPENLPEKLQQKLNQKLKMMRKLENSSQKDFRITENLPEKLKQKLAYKLQM